MLVKLNNGRSLRIPGHHTVFSPAEPLAEGDVIDPATTRLECRKADAYLRGGVAIIVDNVVEVVRRVYDCPIQIVEFNIEDATLFRPPPAEAYR